MNIEQLVSLMPKKRIQEEHVKIEMEEQKKIEESGKRFVSHLSLNRYLHKPLAEFDLEERVHLFDECSRFCLIHENGLYADLDIGNFAALLEEVFGLNTMYELDNVYIKHLLNGRDITKEEFDILGETMPFNDILVRFVFEADGMSMGDTPHLMLMLVVKKALLGSYFAGENAKLLSDGKLDIYDLTPLL